MVAASFHHFLRTWAPLASWAVAAGTLALAWATWRLGTKAKDEADAVNDEVEISRQTQQANIKPRLLNVPISRAGETQVRFEHPKLPSHTYPPPDDLSTTTVYVPFRNVGPGVAFIQRVTMLWEEPGAIVRPTPYMGTTLTKVLPPGEMMLTRFLFEGERDSSRAINIANESARFWVEVEYNDAAGAQMERVRLTHEIGIGAGGRWTLKEVAYYKGEESVPYASSAVQ